MLVTTVIDEMSSLPSPLRKKALQQITCDHTHTHRGHTNTHVSTHTHEHAHTRARTHTSTHVHEHTHTHTQGTHTQGTESNILILLIKHSWYTVKCSEEMAHNRIS